jgi:tRNA-2-methylthio-N6-dimethylallyladenosine synthase
MPKVFIKTYGCQMNERDSEQVSQMLAQRGYELTSSEHEADVILLNTCSVRDMAEQKALGKMGMVSKLREKNPKLVFGFLGCMAQSRGAELLKDLPQVDLVVGTQKFHRVAEYVDQLVTQKTAALESGRMDDLRASIVDVEEERQSQEAIRDHVLAPKQSSAFVSIMQGCNMRCTFCIVPSTRGDERSRSIPEIVTEVTGLAERGVKEVTLLGQIVNLYGRHEFPAVDGKSPFVQLIEAVHAIEGIERIRFTSPHPIGYKADLVEAFTYLPKLVEHIHLPVQSGSNRILKAMHRAYTRERYLDLVEKIRAARPGIAITTDVIVGYPGETDEDFAQTVSLFEQVQFDNAFVFKYSKRRDTPAAESPDQIEDAVKEERNRVLLEVVDASAKRKGDALVGTSVEILCEGPSKTNPARLMGRTRTNKIVIFEGSERHMGQIFDVHVVRSTGFSLYGDPAILS